MKNALITLMHLLCVSSFANLRKEGETDFQTLKRAFDESKDFFFLQDLQAVNQKCARASENSTAVEITIKSFYASREIAPFQPAKTGMGPLLASKIEVPPKIDSRLFIIMDYNSHENPTESTLSDMYPFVETRIEPTQISSKIRMANLTFGGQQYPVETYLRKSGSLVTFMSRNSGNPNLYYGYCWNE